MKPEQWPGNGRGLHVEFHRVREGKNYFVVLYKDSAVIRTDPKEAWRCSSVAKFTAPMQELKQWCIDIYEKYDQPKDDSEGRADTSFASEAQLEPNDQTKMIT